MGSVKTIKINQNVNNIIEYTFDTSINLTGYDCSLYIRKDNVTSTFDVSSFIFTYNASTYSGHGIVVTELSTTDSSLKIGEGLQQHKFYKGTKTFTEGIGTLKVEQTI
jgi:hypothetical protein